MKQRMNSSELIRKEKGSVMIFVAVIIFAAVIVVGLLIENSRKSLSAKNVQDSVDAAALAAVAEMNGSAKGWANAKSSAVKVIQQQDIHGAKELQDLVLDQWSPDSDCGGPCTNDPFDPAVNSGNFGVSGNVQVKVERGFYWYDEDEGAEIFHSVEGNDPDMELDYLDITIQDSENPLPDKVAAKYGLPTFILANAVRVTMTLTDVPTIIGKMLGQTLGTVQRSAIAVSNRNPEQCVAPFAIPACSLLLNTKATSPDDAMIQLDGYQPGLACVRELVFTESNPEIPGRMEGMARARVFPRPPARMDNPRLLNTLMNHPIDGVFGMPGSYSSDPHETTAQDLGNFFKDGVGCVNAKIGEKFKPVQRLLGESGFYDDKSVENAMATYIDDSPHTFTSIFGALNEADWIAQGRRVPRPGLKRNYPHPRVQIGPKGRNPAERIITFPDRLSPSASSDETAAGGVEMAQLLLANIEHPEYWASPMCHSRKLVNANNNLPRHDGTPAAPINPAKARPVKIMVIAPTADDYDYCDWEAVFSHTSQKIDSPTADSAPVVVGFVNGYMYDFNIMDLTNTNNTHATATPNTPTYKLATTVFDNKIRDRSPEMALLANVTVDGDDLEAQYWSYMVNPSHEDGICVEKKCCPGWPDLSSCNSDCDTRQAMIECNMAPGDLSSDGWKANCFDVNATLEEEETLCTSWPKLGNFCGDSDSTKPTAATNVDFIECKLAKARMALPNLPPSVGPLQIAEFLANDGPKYPSRCIRTYALIRMLDSAYAMTKHDMHCLPRLKPGAYDFTDPDAFEKPRNLSPEYGCGGVRVRLDCGEVPGDPESPFKSRPFMLNDDQSNGGSSSGITPMLVK